MSESVAASPRKPKVKAIRSRAAKTQISVVRSSKEKVDTLLPLPGNPKKGQVDEIAKSLDKSGQFRGIVVNMRDRTILAGNHTYKAAVKLGWEFIYVDWVDVDEVQAKIIAVADNRMAELGVYDDVLLARMLADIGIENSAGTGFDPTDIEDMMKYLDTAQESTLETMQIAESATGEGIEVSGVEGEYADTDESIDSETAGVASPVSDPLESADHKVGDGAVLMDIFDMEYERIGKWKVPKLRADRLLKFNDLPKSLSVWAGSATKHITDPKHWWLYNYGIDSMSGMEHRENCILSFYTDDTYFANVLMDADKVFGRVLNLGIRTAITPDYSTWLDDEPVAWLRSIVDSRLVGRYMQEVGMGVIPCIEWPGEDDDWFLREIVLPTLPQGCLISLQAQTGSVKDMDSRRQEARDYETIVDMLKPDGILFYGSKSNYEFFKNLNLPTKSVFIEHRIQVLHERDKKERVPNTV